MFLCFFFFKVYINFCLEEMEKEFNVELQREKE